MDTCHVGNVMLYQLSYARFRRESPGIRRS